RAFKRELRRLEDLSGDFFAIAKRDKNHDIRASSAHLVARLNERICAMRSWAPVKLDPITVEVAQQPSSFERIHAAILRVAAAATTSPVLSMGCRLRMMLSQAIDVSALIA